MGLHIRIHDHTMQLACHLSARQLAEEVGTGPHGPKRINIIQLANFVIPCVHWLLNECSPAGYVCACSAERLGMSTPQNF